MCKHFMFNVHEHSLHCIGLLNRCPDYYLRARETNLVKREADLEIRRLTAPRN